MNDVSQPSQAVGRIAVVDDEAIHVEWLKHALESQGYQIYGFVSAAAAIAALHEDGFDILLTDLHMPEVNGIELLRIALQKDPHLVGIMMTSHGSVESAVEAMKAGALDYILKPFDPKAIAPVLSRAFTVRKLRLENEALQIRLQNRTVELEAAVKELEAFSYSVSHDLGAPLAVIDGYASLLLMKLEGDSAASGYRPLAEHIHSGAMRMHSLIADLLALSRSARAPVRRSSVDFSALARVISREIQEQRSDHSVEWKIADSVVADADPGLLRALTENLLGNAWKYTGKSTSPRIEFGVEGDHVPAVYFVRDNGVGFNVQEAGERLFQAFRRFHPENEFPGTGIGLATVQRIIHKHGGRIWAESSPGCGATFKFTLAPEDRITVKSKRQNTAAFEDADGSSLSDAPA